jgi:hypothetical protein
MMWVLVALHPCAVVTVWAYLMVGKQARAATGLWRTEVWHTDIELQQRCV